MFAYATNTTQLSLHHIELVVRGWPCAAERAEEIEDFLLVDSDSTQNHPGEGGYAHSEFPGCLCAPSDLLATKQRVVGALAAQAIELHELSHRSQARSLSYGGHFSERQCIK